MWVELGSGKGGCSLWVIFQGTLETSPPPDPSSGLLIIGLSQAALPSGSSDFSLEFVIVGSWETRGAGGWPCC